MSNLRKSFFKMFAFSLVIVLIAMFFIVRNEQVFHYRLDLLFRIFELTPYDRYVGNDIFWRYQEYQKVSYMEMFWKFWKPVDAFYSDSILELEVRE